VPQWSNTNNGSALFTFFITYILFEVPSNILLKRLRPSVFLSSIIAIWGIITIGMGCTQSFAGLVVCRLLIGFFEAGFFPGCIYLISMCMSTTGYERKLANYARLQAP